MIVSNSGKMRKLKEVIRNALKVEDIFDIIDGVIDTSCLKLDELNTLLNNRNIPDNIKNSITILNLKREDLLNNSYLKGVTITNQQIGEMVYNNKRRIRKGIVTPYSEDERDLESTYLRKKNYFVIDRVVDLPALYEDGKSVVWMSIEPYEINTLDNFISKASGNVLICGCGLGYTTYMTALKDNVDSITILEQNENVINLFQNQVLPNIPNNDKIHIIKCDANEYLENADLSMYDHISVDLWYDVFDMIYPYLKCLILEEKFPNTNFTYWIESSLLIEIQRELLSYIATGKFVEKYPQLNDVVKGLILDSNEIISNKESLNEFISFDNIRKRLLEWAKKNMDIVEELGLRIKADEENYSSAATEFLSNIQSSSIKF